MIDDFNGFKIEWNNLKILTLNGNFKSQIGSNPLPLYSGFQLTPL